MATSPLGTSPARPLLPAARSGSLVSSLAAHRGLVAVIVVAAALAAWRTAYVLAGIDPDSDAYGHHAIARQILVEPRDLRVHWVWLPLFHYAQALAIAVGATMQSVRLFNVGVAAVTPVALFLLLRLHRREKPEPRWDPSATLAAVLASLSPIAMQMGTTGQTEPLFALLVLATLFALARARHGLAAIAVTIAVLLRYEAWAIPPSLAAFLVLARVPFVRERLQPWERETTGARAWLPVVIPILAVFAWAGLRRATIDPKWFAFLDETRKFANGALGTKSAFQLGLSQVVEDAGYYAIKVPWRVVGYPLLVAPFGIVRTFRREGLRFVLVYAALLAFVTLTWLMRSSLGLDRHFVVIVPLYAALVANGIVAIGAFLDDALRRPTSSLVHGFAVSGAVRAAVVAGLACAVVGDTWSILEVWMRDWRGASEGAWPDRRAIAAQLRDLPEGTTIFCDEPTVEIISGLDRRRFERRLLLDRRTRASIDAALSRGPVYVASWASHVSALKLPAEVLARTPGTTGDEGFVLARLAPAPATPAPR